MKLKMENYKKEEGIIFWNDWIRLSREWNQLRIPRRLLLIIWWKQSVNRWECNSRCSWLIIIGRSTNVEASSAIISIKSRSYAVFRWGDLKSKRDFWFVW